MASAISAKTGNPSHCHHLRPCGPIRSSGSGSRSRIQRSSSPSGRPSVGSTVWRGAGGPGAAASAAASAPVSDGDAAVVCSCVPSDGDASV